MGYFLPFYPPNSPQKFFLKKCLEILSLYICVQKIMIWWWCMTYRCNCCFSFWAISCHFTPLTAQKIKILKKRKKQLEISSFTYVHQKLLWSDDVHFLSIWCVTDGRFNGMDGKSDIKVGAPPKIQKKTWNFGLLTLITRDLIKNLTSRILGN